MQNLGMEVNLYPDETRVLNCMNHMKKLFDILVVLKKGYHQDSPTISTSKRNIYWLFVARTLTYLITVRDIFCLVSDNVHLKYLLGNPYKEKNEGFLLALLMTLTYITIGPFRELVFFYESRGSMAPVAQLNYLLSLSPSQLNSLSRLKVFTAYMKYFLPYWIGLFYLFLCGAPLFCIVIRLINPEIWSKNIYIISSLLWMIPEGLTLIYIIGGLIIFFGHALMFLMIYYSNLCHLLRQFDQLSEIKCSFAQANHLTSKLNHSFIKFLNNVTTIAYDVRYLWLYALLLACGLNNTCIYCGTIKQIKPIIVATSLTIYGVCVFTIASITVHRAGELIEKVILTCDESFSLN